MKILALTGSSSTYCFEDQLLEMAVGTNWHWMIQSTNFEPENVTPRVRLESYIDLKSLESSPDVLITHCGAGSVFWGLENKIPTIAIVNLSRPDDHQMDLGNYLEIKGLCLVTKNRVPEKEEIVAARDKGHSVYDKRGVVDIAKLLQNVTLK